MLHALSASFRAGRHVSTDDDPAVVGPLRGSVLAALPPSLSPPLRAEARRLIDGIGSPTFYDVVATIDPKDASGWREMGRVQRTFRAAEPRFDARTRAYSESMRLTLHAAVILHLVDPTLQLDASGRRRPLFESFLELHVTAFRENGGWFGHMEIPWSGAASVVGHTRLSVLAHGRDLVDGIDLRDPAAIRAAAWVAQARAGA
jgi:hypothetical protein